MHSTVSPVFAFLHTSSAPANVAPAVMPTKMPSFCASSRLHFMASGPAMVRIRLITPISTASPVIFGMKSGLQPCIGCGLNAGLGLAGEPSGLRSCLALLESIGASAGSHTTIFVSGRSLAKHTGNTLKRAAGPESGHPIVEPLALEVIDDFPSRRARVHVGIGFVLELAGGEPTMRFRKFDCLVDHSDCTIGGRGKNNLCAEGPHEVWGLDTEGLCHRDNQRIPFRCADHRKTDSSIA